MLALAKDSDFAQRGAGMMFDLWDVFCDREDLFDHNCTFQSHYDIGLSISENKCNGKMWCKSSRIKMEPYNITFTTIFDNSRT